MPRATVDTTAAEKFDLKTCEGAFVALRRLSYGEKLHRTGLSMQMNIEGDNPKNAKMAMEMMQERTTLFDFSKCIVDHNLEDDNGKKLNLATAQDMNRLHPQIGEEISTLIDKMNNFEEDEGN